MTTAPRTAEVSGSTRYDPSTVYYQAFDTKGVLLQGVLKLVHASKTWVGIRQGEKGKQELLELGFNDVRPVNIIDLTKPPVTEAETQILQGIAGLMKTCVSIAEMIKFIEPTAKIHMSQLSAQLDLLARHLAKLSADNDLWGTVTKSVMTGANTLESSKTAKGKKVR